MSPDSFTVTSRLSDIAVSNGFTDYSLYIIDSS